MILKEDSSIELIKLIAEDSENGFLIVNESNTVYFCNKSLLCKIGISHSLRTNPKLNDLFAEDAVHSEDYTLHGIKKKKSDKYELVKITIPNGESYYCKKTVYNLADSDENTLLHKFEFLNTEVQQLNEHLNKLSQVITQSSNSIIITDKKGKIEFVNPSFSNLTNYDHSEILGLNISLLESELNPEEVYRERKQAIQAGISWDGILYGVSKDGRIFCERNRLTPLYSSSGEFTHILSISEDISEQIKTEDELKEHIEELQFNKDLLEENSNEMGLLNALLASSEEKLKTEIASKDKFFSIISHDLKSPLAGVLGLTEMLEEDYQDLTEEERVEMIGHLNSAAKKMFELLDSLLHWARAQSGKLECILENINLTELTSSLISMYAENAKKKNISLIVNLPKKLILHSDKNILNTVLRNLIANAIKFTNVDGMIEISAIIDNNIATISVADNGVGMSQEDQDKLFKIDVHHTTRGTSNEEGTGLGLVLCKELINKNNGEIWINSKEGKGTTFYFTVPLPTK